MINFTVQMKLNKFAYLYSKPLGNHTLKIMKKIPGNLLQKTWKNHGNIMEFCQSEKEGTLDVIVQLYNLDRMHPRHRPRSAPSTSMIILVYTCRQRHHFYERHL